VDLTARLPADELDDGTAGGTRGEAAAARSSRTHAPVTGREENGARIRCTGTRGSSPCSRLGRRSEGTAVRRRAAEFGCRRWGRRRGWLQSLRETAGEGGETAEELGALFPAAPLGSGSRELAGGASDLASGAAQCSSALWCAGRQEEQAREREI
jgi:X-X-X-Leu-X-X-Gly heptad repeat protein